MGSNTALYSSFHHRYNRYNIQICELHFTKYLWHSFIYPFVHLRMFLNLYSVSGMVLVAGSTAWDKKVEKHLCTYWAKASIIIVPILQLRNWGTWRLSSMVKITPWVCGRTKGGNQPPSSKASRPFPLYYTTNSWAGFYQSFSIFIAMWLDK